MKHVSTLAILVTLAACSSVDSQQSPKNMGTTAEALDSAQCLYFDTHGKDMICHANGSTTHPYTLVNVSDNACENAHANHPLDYITSNDPASPLYDPTCGGGGCLPSAAPCDSSLPCCDGLVCTAGTCVSARPVAPPGGCLVNLTYSRTDGPMVVSMQAGQYSSNGCVYKGMTRIDDTTGQTALVQLTFDANGVPLPKAQQPIWFGVDVFIGAPIVPPCPPPTVDYTGAPVGGLVTNCQ